LPLQRERKREREKRNRDRTIIMFTTDSYVDAKIMFALHGLVMGMACKETLSLKKQCFNSSIMSDVMIICPPRKERNVDFNPGRGRDAKNPEPRHVRPFAALSTQGPYL
jgi:hypothetical protein